MLKDDDLKYIEQEIKKTISSIENTHCHELIQFEQQYEVEEYPGYTKDWI